MLSALGKEVPNNINFKKHVVLAFGGSSYGLFSALPSWQSNMRSIEAILGILLFPRAGGVIVSVDLFWKLGSNRKSQPLRSQRKVAFSLQCALPTSCDVQYVMCTKFTVGLAYFHLLLGLSR